MLAKVGVTVTPVTLVIELLMVIALVAVLFPSCVVTVMVALPTVTPETSPLLFIVAADVLLELQLIVLLVAFAGKMTEVNCCVAFTDILADIGLTLIPVTRVLTVILLVAVLPPSCVVAVIITLPDTTPVISPLRFTVATDILLELQLIVLLIAFKGKMTAVNCCVSFTEIISEAVFMLIPVTTAEIGFNTTVALPVIFIVEPFKILVASTV